jgi:glycosyltransferase involved in cell wall biosynthesis
MNILLINHYAGSNQRGMEYRPYYMAREWVKQGHTVTIVAATFSHLRVENPTHPEDYKEEEIDGIRYIWLKTPPYDGNGVKRVINIFAFLRQLYRYEQRILAGEPYNAVIASSTYPLDNVPARRFARKCKAKWVYEVHDLWPLTLIELGGMSPRHPFIMLLQWGENFAYKNVDGVVCMLPAAEPHMREHGLPAGKCTIVPNGAIVGEFQNVSDLLPDQHRELLDNLKAQGKFLVAYTGSIGLPYALQHLVEAGKRLEKEDVAIVFMGDGPVREQLAEQAKEIGANNIHFLPWVPKKALPAVLEKMDVLYLGWRRTRLYSFGISPNKLLDYMLASKPVIHANVAANDMVAESGAGFSVPAEDVEAITDAIRKMKATSPEERAEMGIKGRTYVIEQLDYPVLAKKFADALK